MLFFSYLHSAISWPFALSNVLASTAIIIIFTCHNKLLSGVCCASRTHTVRWHGILRCLMCLRALLPRYVWFPCRSLWPQRELVHLWVKIQYWTIVLICSALHHPFLVRAGRYAHTLVYSRTQLYVPFAFSVTYYVYRQNETFKTFYFTNYQVPGTGIYLLYLSIYPK